MDTLKEEWKPIIGCKGFSISNLGRVKRCSYIKQYDNGDVERGSEVIIAPHVTDYGLSVTINSRAYLVHRLVAKTFMDPSNTRDYVRFVDGDKLNCRVDNLKFVSVSDAMKEAIANGERHTPGNYPGIAIQCVETGERFSSIKAVTEHTGMTRWTVTKRIRDHRPINGLHYEVMKK